MQLVICPFKTWEAPVLVLSFVQHKISPPGHPIVSEYNLPNLIALANRYVPLFEQLRNNMAPPCECEVVQSDINSMLKNKSEILTIKVKHI